MTRLIQWKEATNLWLLWVATGLGVFLGVPLLTSTPSNPGKMLAAVLASAVLICYELARFRRDQPWHALTCWGLGGPFFVLSLPIGVSFMVILRMTTDWTEPALMVSCWCTITVAMALWALYVTGDEWFTQVFPGEAQRNPLEL